MEEWRVLANRVRSTLLPIATATRTVDFLWLIDAAYKKLATNVCISRSILMGATDIEHHAIPTPPPNGYGPVDLIELARSQFEALRGDHAIAGHIFVLYGTRLGLLQGDGDPMWQAWEGHQATAIQNANRALQGLRKAAACCQASVDALALAMSFPPRSPAWLAWVSASESHTRCAIAGVTTAAVMVHLMRLAVLAEYIDASMLLNR